MEEKERETDEAGETVSRSETDKAGGTVNESKTGKAGWTSNESKAVQAGESVNGDDAEGGNAGFRYDAFISYRHAPLDLYVAQTLQRRLETFKVPKLADKETKELGKKSIRRIFRDKDELPLAGNLSEPIMEALSSSEYLFSAHIGIPVVQAGDRDLYLTAWNGSCVCRTDRGRTGRGVSGTAPHDQKRGRGRGRQRYNRGGSG